MKKLHDKIYTLENDLLNLLDRPHKLYQRQQDNTYQQVLNSHELAVIELKQRQLLQLYNQLGAK